MSHVYRSLHLPSFIMGKRIYIRAADSWHQPSKKTEFESIVELSFTLLSLNDDCLLHLFKFFNIIDIINLSKTCGRFKAIIEPIFMKCETFTLNSVTTPALSLMDVYTQLSNLGTYIRSLTISGVELNSDNHRRHLELVYRHCHSLDELHLQKVIVATPLCKEPAMDSLKNLKVLELINCKRIDNDYLLAKLGLNCQITELKLVDFNITSINGPFFYCLEKLQKIHLDRCDELVIFELKNWFKKNIETLTHVTLFRLERGWTALQLLDQMKNVQHLQIDLNIYKVNSSMLDSLDGQLTSIKSLYIPRAPESVTPIIKELRLNNKQIEELDLSYRVLADEDSSKSDLLELKSLQLLKLNETTGVDSSFLLDCAKSLTNLRVLCCRKANISDSDVADIVQNAVQLIELDVAYCTKVTFDVTRKVATVLQADLDRPKFKLTINYFNGCDLVSYFFFPVANLFVHSNYVAPCKEQYLLGI